MKPKKRKLPALMLALALALSGCGRADETVDPYAGMIQVESGGGTLMWVKDYENVAVSGFESGDFTSAGGRAAYRGSEYVTLTGVDVSEHQMEIDWHKVAADGIDFAVVRLGYRGYTEGGLFVDPWFEENFEGARSAGLRLGVYFFSQALTPEEAREEARLVLDTLRGRGLDLPVYYDWEAIDGARARTDGLDGAAITQCALAFCEEIESAGYSAGIYTYRYLGYFMYDLDAIDEYPLWLSTDGAYPDFHYYHTMWQYSTSGTVDGVNGPVDLNLRFLPVQTPGA